MSNSIESGLKEENIKKDLIRCYLFGLCILLLSIPLALWETLRPVDESPAIWFQRSGSVIVIFSLFLELRILKIWKMLHQIDFIDDVGNGLSQKYSRQYMGLNIILVLLVVIGTAIWGYGDLIYKLIV